MNEKDNFINVYEIGNSIIKMINAEINKVHPLVEKMNQYMPTELGCICIKDCHIHKDDLCDWNFCFCGCKIHGAEITPYTKKEVADSTIALLKQMGL